MTKVVKRNGDVVNFDKSKIKKAIVAAMKKGSGIYMPDIARIIAGEVERKAEKKEVVTIKEIEDMVYLALCSYGQSQTAKSYESYRAVHEFKRGVNTSDEAVLSLINGSDADLLDENSNKVSTVVSTQRDLIAGEVNKDIARRKMLPTHLVQAHDAGILHIHK